MDTLLLDVPTWDLTLDTSGNLAVASGGYAIAQDVASAVRLFKGELWYDTLQGIPYFEQVLGKIPPFGFLAAMFAVAGETVPEVLSISVTLNPIPDTRLLTGTLKITSTSGVVSIVTASVQAPWYVSAVGGQDYGVP